MRRLDAEQREIIACDLGDENAVRSRSLGCEPDEADAVAGDVLEEIAGGGLVVLQIRERHGAQSRRRRANACNDREPAGISDRKRAKENCIDDAEHVSLVCSVRSWDDPDRNCDRPSSAIPAWSSFTRPSRSTMSP